MKIFAITYIVLIFVLAIAWPLIGVIMPAGVPGDGSIMIGEMKVHLLFGTSLIISSTFMIVLWMLGKL